MKRKMIKPAVTAACLAIAMLVAQHANAVLLSTALSDPYSIGSVVPGTPANPDTEADYINQLISMSLNGSTTVSGNAFTRSGNSFSPLDTAANGVATAYGNPQGTITIDVGSGYEYLTAKYDGSSGGTFVWYIKGLTSITISAFDGQWALSTTTLLTPTAVPDGGSTVALLGCGLAGIGIFSRKFRKN